MATIRLLVVLFGLALAPMVLSQPSANNAAVCWGWSQYHQPIGGSTAELLNGVLQSSYFSGMTWASIIAGQYATCAVSWSTGPDDSPPGTLYCWGHTYTDPPNDLYINTWTQQTAGGSPVPVSIDEGVTTFVPGSVAIGKGINWQSICGITLAGGTNNIFCTGSSLIANPPVGHWWSLNNSTVCVGDAFACAVSLHGQMFCWGGSYQNPWLDTSNTLNPGVFFVPTVPSTVLWSSVTCGINFACGILANGTFLCWGDLSTWTNFPVPTWGVTPSPLPGFPAQPGFPQNALAASAGWYHVCVIVLASSHLHCFGASPYAALLTAPATNIVSGLPPVVYTSLSMSSFGGCAQPTGTAVPQCWNANYYDGPLNPIPSGVNFWTPPSLPAGTVMNAFSGGYDYYCGVTW